MNKEQSWLADQLPVLVSKGIITEEIAAKLRNYYQLHPAEERSGWRTVFVMLGVLLLALGILLLLAHNWEQLKRTERMFVIGSGLIVAQIISAYVVGWRHESRFWREGAATFHFFMVGASIFLTGQTYHLTDSYDNFLLLWLMLSLPLVYILRSAMAAALIFIGVGIGSSFLSDGIVQLLIPLGATEFWSGQLLWFFILVLLPFWCQLAEQETCRRETHLLTVLLLGSAISTFAVSTVGQYDYLAPLRWMYFFSIFYFASVFLKRPIGSNWRRIFRVTGIGGALGISFLFTFRGFWEDLLRPLNYLFPPSELVITVLLGLVVLAGLVYWIRRQTAAQWMYTSLPAILSLAYAVHAFSHNSIIVMVGMNLWLLFVGIFWLQRGIRQDSLALLNVGLGVLIALISARFLVDDNLGFMIRGLVFIGMGAGFLLVNWLVARRRKGGQSE